MQDHLDAALAPLVRLRDATADLLASAQKAYDDGDVSQNNDTITRIQRQLDSFDQQLARSRRLLDQASNARRGVHPLRP
ncbi:MAG: hypothetical protein ACO4B5_11855 [Steroidobacteraceae bacterium]